MIVHGKEVNEAEIPRLAIRPYPSQYISSWTARDGTALEVRPIRPEDEPLVVAFHAMLSEQTVSMRYFHPMKLSTRVAHERLARVCFIDYDRDIAALWPLEANPQTGEHEILGIGRLCKIRGTDEAEFSLVVADRFQRLGLATMLLSRLIEIGRDEKIAQDLRP